MGSALWTLSTQYVLVNKAGWTEGDALPASVASGAAVGIAKEMVDATRPAGTASARDLAANAVGIALATGLIVL
jgi:VanZ family protein